MYANVKTQHIHVHVYMHTYHPHTLLHTCTNVQTRTWRRVGVGREGPGAAAELAVTSQT